MNNDLIQRDLMSSNSPKHGFDKHAQRLDVYQGAEGLTEVHLQPAHQGTLKMYKNGNSLYSLIV